MSMVEPSRIDFRSHSPSDDQASEQQVSAARVAVMYGHGPMLIFGTLITGALAAAVLWRSEPAGRLLAWLMVLYAWTAVRYGVNRLYHRAQAGEASAAQSAVRWGWAGAVVSWGFAVIWGAVALLFLDADNSAAMVLIPVLIIGLTASVNVSLASFPPASVGFAVIASGMLLAALLREGGELMIPLGALVVINLLFGFSNLRLSYGVLGDSLRLRFRNQALQRESERKSDLLQTTLANMGQGIALADRRGWLHMWNPRLLALTGASLTEARPRLEQLYQRLHAVDDSSAADTSIWRHADGRLLEMQVTSMANGESVLTCIDVTRRLRREQALDEARRSAEQANIAKTRFLAAASHDLRQPVQALGLLHEVLEERARGTQLHALVEQMGQGISSADALLESLLHISKLDAGLDEPEWASIPLTELFSDLEEEFRSIADDRGNQLRFRSTAICVRSDRFMLTSVLSNLIANALKYTHHGKVLVVARRRAGAVRVSVYDTGPGIPPEQAERIFDEFHQLHNPQRDRNMGLGLGLAIVKRTLEVLGHRIDVSSQPGSGACFSVTLPLASSQPQQRETASPAAAPTDELAGQLIWVVDDDPIVVQALTGLLAFWGCRTGTATDLDSALALAADAAYPPALILLDYRLPAGVTGLQVAAAMREQLAQPVPCLLLTGDTAPERLREASASGFPLLHKPATPAALRQALLESLRSDRSILTTPREQQ